MHRATNTGLYLRPPCLSITIVTIGNHRCSTAMARLAMANFGAQEGGPYCGPTSPPYQGLCGLTRLQAVLSVRSPERPGLDYLPFHSERTNSYQTSPCSLPGKGSGQSTETVRAYFKPIFSITRRDAWFTAIVVATIFS